MAEDQEKTHTNLTRRSVLPDDFDFVPALETLLESLLRFTVQHFRTLFAYTFFSRRFYRFYRGEEIEERSTLDGYLGPLTLITTTQLLTFYLTAQATKFDAINPQDPILSAFVTIGSLLGPALEEMNFAALAWFAALNLLYYMSFGVILWLLVRPFGVKVGLLRLSRGMMYFSGVASMIMLITMPPMIYLSSQMNAAPSEVDPSHPMFQLFLGSTVLYMVGVLITLVHLVRYLMLIKWDIGRSAWLSVPAALLATTLWFSILIGIQASAYTAPADTPAGAPADETSETATSPAFEAPPTD